jgi:LysR family glycine cleavage system transcriptional activator
MRRLIPPTHLLRAFLATAQYGSIARAAEALHLTPSAVSKQIGELERWLAMPLFERERKRLTLTEWGERYRTELAPILSQLEAATFELMRSSSGGAGVLKLSVMPTLGDTWLMPQLPQFHDLHPEIDLRFSTLLGEEELALSSLDCAVRYGGPNWPGMAADYLGGREVVVVAPPKELLHHPLNTPHDLRHYTLLHHVITPEGWPIWLKAHQVEGLDALPGPQRTLASSLIAAVSRGEGVALIPECLIRGEVQRGTVTVPFAPYIHSEGYYLCYPEQSLEYPPFLTFRSWLLELAERTLQTDAPSKG